MVSLGDEVCARVKRVDVQQGLSPLTLLFSFVGGFVKVRDNIDDITVIFAHLDSACDPYCNLLWLRKCKPLFPGRPHVHRKLGGIR